MDSNFFKNNQLNIETGEVAVGETYPIYGMITNIIDDTPGQVLVELNFSITAYLNLSTTEKVELVKERAFEAGIFVSTILEKSEGHTIVNCQTIIFGKKKEGFDA